MNRFRSGLSAVSEPPIDEWHFHTAPGNFCQTADLPPALPFGNTVFLPVHLEKSYRYPLLVWLHGENQDHDQLGRIMPLVSDRNYIGISVRGTRRCRRGGFGWCQNPEAIETAANRVCAAVRLAEAQLPVDSGRVFIAGSGPGGTMAYRIAFGLAWKFSGAACFNGPVPENHTPLVNLSRCRRVPLYWVQERDSLALPETDLCRQLRLLHIGGFDVTMRQYPGGDRLAEQPYTDLNTWMMEVLASRPDSGIVL